MEKYTTGTNQKICVHERNSECDISCVIHNPTNHSMKDFPTHWRSDRQLIERICPHGVGHPDPDHMAFLERNPQFIPKGSSYWAEGIHGCDGCCVNYSKETKCE